MSEIYFDEGKAKLDGFEIPVHCILMKAGKGKSFALKHYHEYVELLYGISADISVWADGKVMRVKSGELCVLNSGTAHSVMSNIAESTYLVIKFMPQILYAAEQSVFEFKYLLPFLADDEMYRKVFSKEELSETEIPGIMEEIKNEWLEKNYGYEIALRACVIRTALWLTRKWNSENSSVMQQGESMKYIKKAMEYAESDFETANSFDAAKLCNLSYSYFSRLFKRTMGKSFTEYVMSVKINEAKKLLAKGDKNVTEIAMELGFSSVSYFTGQFKRETGLTPHKFIKDI